MRRLLIVATIVYACMFAFLRLSVPTYDVALASQAAVFFSVLFSPVTVIIAFDW